MLPCFIRRALVICDRARCCSWFSRSLAARLRSMFPKVSIQAKPSYILTLSNALLGSSLSLSFGSFPQFYSVLQGVETIKDLRLSLHTSEHIPGHATTRDETQLCWFLIFVDLTWSLNIAITSLWLKNSAPQYILQFWMFLQRLLTRKRYMKKWITRLVRYDEGLKRKTEHKRDTVCSKWQMWPDYHG